MIFRFGRNKQIFLKLVKILAKISLSVDQKVLWRINRKSHSLASLFFSPSLLYILLQALGRCSSASAGDPIFSVRRARRRAQSESSTVTSWRHLLTWWGEFLVIRRAILGINQEDRCLVSSSLISPWLKLSSRFVSLCLMLWHPLRVLTPKMSFKWRHSSRVIAAKNKQERKSKISTGCLFFKISTI